MVDLAVVFVSVVGATVWAVGGWLRKIDRNENGIIEVDEFDPKSFAKTLVLGAAIGVGASFTGAGYADLAAVPLYTAATIYIDAGLKATGIYRYLDEVWARLNGSAPSADDALAHAINKRHR